MVIKRKSFDLLSGLAVVTELSITARGTLADAPTRQTTAMIPIIFFHATFVGAVDLADGKVFGSTFIDANDCCCRYIGGIYEE